MKNIIQKLTKESELQDLSRDIIEIVVDEVIEEGIIKELPIVKTIYSISKSYHSITDKIQLKKTLLVLLELKDLDEKEKDKFLQELEDKYTSGSEKLMLAISHLQTYEKCIVFGKLSLLKAKGEINLDEYLRILKIVQDCNLNDLKLIKSLDRNIQNYLSMDEYHPLFNLGLIYQYISEPTPISETYGEYEGGDFEVAYYLTKIGTTLFDIFDDIKA